MLLLAAIGYLFRSAFTDALQYYVTVEELQAAPPPRDRVVKVGGTVKRGTLVQQGDHPVTYTFSISQGEHALPVRYVGLVPDTFHEGGEVVATGRLNATGELDASHILAKCASKYQAAAPGVQ